MLSPHSRSRRRRASPPETLEAAYVASHAVVRATIVDAKTVLTPARPGEKFSDAAYLLLGARGGSLWRNGEQAFRPYFGPEMMVELQQDTPARLARR